MARPALRNGPTADAVAFDAYARRGSECTFANLKVLGRVAGTVYDAALRPLDLRAGQLALLWSIAASQPVEMGRLSTITIIDQTTLSRTVAKLARSGLVRFRAGHDGRVKMITLTAAGRRRFLAAMPLWEQAQQQIGEMLPAAVIRTVARNVRKAARSSL